MENTQLTAIIEFLDTQDEKLNKLLEKSTSTDNNSEIATLNEKLTTLDKNYKEYMDGLVLFLEFLKLVKTKILEASEKIPAEVHQTIKFDSDSRNQVWLTFIGILFFLTTSIIAVNYYNDNTNYKRAWDYLLEQETSVKSQTYLNSILDNAK